ncbi:MAG: DUF817 domain-containing protein [Acidimicrobiia bacterium]|nr:DUF817 domain-containing protein [Acidimicrobiia bacterium]
MQRIGRITRELAAFTWKEALSCVFAVAMFALIFLTARIPLGPFHRYDVILVGAILAQWAMVKSGLESWDELRTITLFHVVGLGLELFKTMPSIGSWAYPEDAWTKLGGVPLYAGFMYAAVASYMMQAWRRLDVHLVRYPAPLWTVPLVIAIYANFFTHHYIQDVRWLLMALVFLVFGRTWIEFTPLDRVRRMPAVVGFFLIGFFIWVAENLASFLGAYQYPDQVGDWQLVHPGKIGSWFILAIMSFVMVADLKHLKSTLRGAGADPAAEDATMAAQQGGHRAQ